MNMVVFGIYGTRRQVENAVEELKAEGFKSTEISVLFPENAAMPGFASEGAVAGTVPDAASWGVLGWLGGIGVLPIPGLGPFIAAGPMMGRLGYARTAGAVASIAGALMGLGIPEQEARRYETTVQRGGILLSVHTEDSRCQERANRVLEETGAEDIGLSPEPRPNVAGAGRHARSHT